MVFHGFWLVSMVFKGGVMVFHVFLLVSFTPGLLEYLGPEELTQYYVKKYSIEETNLKKSKGLSVSIMLGRRLLGTILTLYLPTVLLNVIGNATNFFKPFFFEAFVTVNLKGR